MLTFLEHLGPINLDQAGVGILVLFPVAHGGQNEAGCGGKLGAWRKSVVSSLEIGWVFPLLLRLEISGRQLLVMGDVLPRESLKVSAALGLVDFQVLGHKLKGCRTGTSDNVVRIG